MCAEVARLISVARNGRSRWMPSIASYPGSSWVGRYCCLWSLLVSFTSKLVEHDLLLKYDTKSQDFSTMQYCGKYTWSVLLITAVPATIASKVANTAGKSPNIIMNYRNVLRQLFFRVGRIDHIDRVERSPKRCDPVVFRWCQTEYCIKTGLFCEIERQVTSKASLELN